MPRLIELTLLGLEPRLTPEGAALVANDSGMIEFSVDSFTACESQGTTTLSLTRSEGSTGRVSVVVQATGGTAIPGDDYLESPITVSFAEGQTRALFPFTLIDGSRNDGTRTVVLSLSNPVGGAILGERTEATVRITDDDIPPLLAVSIGQQVSLRNPGGSTRFSVSPFLGFTGMITTATGDINGDGTPDLVVGAGEGGEPHIKIYDGRSGRETGSFFAFDSRGRTGVFVAVGDVNSDGFADIVVGAGAGAGPHVKVFDGTNRTELSSFFAFGTGFSGGVRVATGDLNRDGFDDLILGAGAGAGPHVRVLSGANNRELRSFIAFDSNYLGGVFVASGDLNGDGVPDLVVSSGSGTSHVRGFDGSNTHELNSFFAYQLVVPGGVHVATKDLDGDGAVEIITAPGGGISPLVRAFSPETQLVLGETLLDDPTFSRGVFLG
jgi:hypothetical protein